MTVIENSVEIQRPLDEVVAYLSDPRHELEWNPKVRVMELVSDEPIGLGSKFRAKWTRSPLVNMECTLFDPPRAWCWVNDGPIEVALQVQLHDTGRGSTVLRTRFDATPHGAIRLLWPLIRRSLQREESRNMTLIAAQLNRAN